ncbi:MAG: hypothetical protein QOH72_3847 [Solirubrobacteraceae bacterium]|jgi:N-methylhydantoinase A/oxoprolinase/acetone carboxylase beta subunit|nr:hypothetical protein [Solirubrobacteraceae bacterium]
MPARDLRLAIDVGLTNVDGVVLDRGDHVVARVKVPVGSDARAGVRAALGRLAGQRTLDPARIARAMLGSRAALEAVTARRGLLRVAVVRIGAPLTLAVPPLATWPGDLRRAASAGEVVIGGGARYDGHPGGRLDEDALAEFLTIVAGHAEAIAVTSVFSPMAPEHELAAADVARRELGGGVPVSLSHEIGSLGLLERENATVLNAALVGVAGQVAATLRDALEGHDVDAELYFGQNDGTVMTLEHAVRFPVLMIGSGPASAMRGAAWLSGVTGGVVVDVGGTRTDVGSLVNGFPREAPPPTEIAGVRASFRTPDVITLPFGGGSATLTHAAAAGGRAELGSRSLSLRERRALGEVLAEVDAELADAIDRAKGTPRETALVVVGGAAMLVPGDLPGVSDVIVPADGALAGAIGLAIAPAGGQADRICENRPEERQRAVAAARAEAFARAIHAGADPDRVAVVEVDETPLAYMRDPAIRVRVKAMGPRT